jgi:hypothetical protein
MCLNHRNFWRDSFRIPGSRCVGKRAGGNTSPDNLPFGVVIVLLLANNVYTELLSYICSVKKCLITKTSVLNRPVRPK